MKNQVIAVLLCAGVILSGCVTTGNDQVANENQDTVAKKIIEGKTTKNEVRSLYGEPNSISTGSAGAESWTYSYGSVKNDPKKWIPIVGILLEDGDKHTTKVLLISFNKKGVVERYNFVAQNSTTKAY